MRHLANPRDRQERVLDPRHRALMAGRDQHHHVPAGCPSLDPYGSVRRVGVLAQTCSTCGKVAVFVGSVRVGTISLASSTPGRRLIVLPDLGTTLRGYVRIVVVSSGKRVSVDGVLATSLST